MTNCIVVLNLPSDSKPNQMYEISFDTIKDYAKKYDIPLEVITTKEFENAKNYAPHVEKFQLYHHLSKYDRVLFLDLDIIVSRNAPNIFEELPEGNYLFDEGYMDFTQRDAHFFEEVYGYEFPTLEHAFSVDNDDTVIGTGKHKRVLNTGVMLLDKSVLIPLLNFDPSAFRRSFEEGTIGGEQTYLNMMFARHGTTVKLLDWKWNCLVYTPNMRFRRHDAYFVHYAGRGEDDLIFRDYDEGLI